MDSAQLAASLLRLTGNLTPTTNSTAEQLSQLRRDLTQILQNQPLAEMLPSTTADFQAILSSQPFVTNEVVNLLSNIAHDAEAAATSPASDLRVFRREVPVLTSQNPASVPRWAAGQSVTSTLGPFTDNTRRLYWFDFYRFRRQLKVARGNAAAVFLSIPVWGLLHANNNYALGAGSVWFKSALLAPSAPAEAFTGLKIKHGSLRINGPVSVSGDTIVIASDQSCELDLELDQPVAPLALDTSTGNDAKEMTITLPQHITLECTSAEILLKKSDPMGLIVYGQEYKFESAGSKGAYEPILNRLKKPTGKGRCDCSLMEMCSATLQISWPRHFFNA